MKTPTPSPRRWMLLVPLMAACSSAQSSSDASVSDVVVDDDADAKVTPVDVVAPDDRPDVANPPGDVFAPPDTPTPSDVVTPPVDVVTPPADVVAPRDVVTPPLDVVTPPIDVVTPRDVVTPPIDVVTPRDVVTPPIDVVTPRDVPVVDVPADVPVTTTGTAVTMFQFDAQRTGANRSERTLTPAVVIRGFGRNTAFAPTLDDEVYGQALYLPQRTVAGVRHDVLFVATQRNSIYALDADTGRPLWNTNLGTAVMRAQQSCGNVNRIGVLGTPVIDEAAGTLYAVSFVSESSGLAFKLNALDVATGTQRSGYPVALSPPTTNGSSFDTRTTGQRGALALRDGRVFVAFGGLYGDCGIYHGWVVGVDTARPTSQVAFATPGRGSGIWGVGGPSMDEGGRLFVATGNSTPLGSSTAGSLGEFVLRLGGGATGPTFSLTDATAQFSPSNARTLDVQDLDIGTMNPVVLPAVTGAPRMIFQSGKEGVMYLLNRENLGGATPLFSGRLCSGGLYGAAAAWAGATDTWVFAPARGSITGCTARSAVAAMRLTVEGGAPRLSTAWCSVSLSNPSPPAISSNGAANAILWVTGASTSGGGAPTLRAYNIADGTEIFSDAPPSVRQWAPITVADGRVFVIGSNTVYQYRPR